MSGFWLPDALPAITIRRSTNMERREKFPPLARGGKRLRVPKYVVVSDATGEIFAVFGIPQGGDVRAEAVFWAERLASKNGYEYEPPYGWENIEGKLPERVA